MERLTAKINGNDADQDIKSPCIRQCCLDTDDVCVGCYRTITEIMDWHQSTQNQKKDKKQYKTKKDKKLFFIIFIIHRYIWSNGI